MKKLIYIFPVFILCFFIFNNIYASEFTDVNDFYDYLENNNYIEQNYNDYDLIIDYDTFINSSDFQNIITNYEYYAFIPYLNENSPHYVSLIVSNYEFSLDITFYSNSYCIKYYSDGQNVCKHYPLSVGAWNNYELIIQPGNENGSSFTTYYSNSMFLLANSNKIYTSRDYFINNFRANFDVKMHGSNNSVVPAPEPIISTYLTYNDNFTQATLSAEIINATGNETLYYSDDLIYNSGLESSSSGTQHSGGGASFDNDLFKRYTASLIYSENKVVVFRILDCNGNIINSTTVNITDIGTLNNIDFTVDFDTSQAGYLIFTPHLKSANNAYFNIYSNCSLSNIILSDYLIISRDDFRVVDTNENNFSLLSNNETITFKYTSNQVLNLTLNFEIRNKSTGSVVLTKNYNFSMKNGVNTISNNLVDDTSLLSLNENSNINDILGAARTTFNTFGNIFSLLPGFVWGFLGVVLVVLLVLRILGR